MNKRPPYADAAPDKAFALGTVAGYDEGFRDASKGAVDLIVRLEAERDALRAENDRLRVLWDQSGKNDLIAERDALRAQLDNMTTEWRTKRLPKVVQGKVILPAVREQRLVGPWVEVTG